MMNNEFNNQFNANGFGLPSAGFGSRGKAAHIGSIATDGLGGLGPVTSRTSRSHLLANLRTAPRPDNVPASAPPTKLRYSMHRGLTAADEAVSPMSSFHPPQPSAKVVPQSMQSQAHNLVRPAMHQGLTPLTRLAMDDLDAQTQVDLLAAQYNQLMQQQLRLQQQLINVTAAASHVPQMDISGNFNYHQGGIYGPNSVMPRLAPYSVQAHQGLTGYANPLGLSQNGLFRKPSPLGVQPDLGHLSRPELHTFVPAASHSPPALDLMAFRKPPTPTVKVSPPPQENTGSRRPLKMEPAVVQVSGAATGSKDDLSVPKRTHKKVTSLALNQDALRQVCGGARTAQPRATAASVTPITGTFMPGQQRAGEHPCRQPRGPPPLDELVEKPTRNVEDSKNFAVFHRRHAFNSISVVKARARTERRNESGASSNGSLTPPSEQDMTFSPQSETESISSKSATDLSAKLSFTSFRTLSRGAIGSEMEKALKERSRERGSIDSSASNSSSGSLGSSSIHGSVADVVATAGLGKHGRMQSILPIVGAAEKRKGVVFHSTKPSINTLFG